MNILKIGIITFIINLAGCAIHPDNLIKVHAYKGKKLPISELATFYGQFGFGTEATYLGDINGKSYSTMGAFTGDPSVAYVKPGIHKIELIYSWYGRFARSQVFEIEVQKGDVYKVNGRTIDGEYANFWIEPKTKNQGPTNTELMPSLKVN